MWMKLIVWIFCGVFALCNRAAAQTGFENLAHIGHSTTISLHMKDGTCQSGLVVKTTPTSVTVHQYKKPPVTVMEDELLWADESNIDAHDFLYSARNSWQDVIDAKPESPETLQIVMKDGRRFKVKPARVAPDEIVVGKGRDAVTLPKNQVETVDYVRQKPISDGEKQLLQEAAVLFFVYPDTWLRASALYPKISVRLFDAARPEDGPLPKCAVPPSQQP
jgi:hypothetical protein